MSPQSRQLFKLWLQEEEKNQKFLQEEALKGDRTSESETRVHQHRVQAMSCEVVARMLKEIKDG